MSVFTRADIEIDTFTEYRKHGESIEDLYAYLEDLKSQGIYVVDVTLVSTRTYESSYCGTKVYYEYMIRLVRPKYQVYLTINHLDNRTHTYYFHRSESIGFFKSAEEAEAIKNEYFAKNTKDVQFIVDVKRFEPLNESI